MLKNGTNMAELFAVLKTFSTKTSSILSGGLSHVNVTFSFRKKVFTGWKVRTVGIARNTPVYRLKGCRYTTFLDALDALYKSTRLFDMDYGVDTGEPDGILCYQDTDPVRKDRKIVSYWYDITPGIPYVLEERQPKFKVICLELTEWEYSQMMETKLAFRHGGIFYPITKAAARSVSVKLNTATLFKDEDEIPLGGALQLAAKYAKMNYLNVLYRSHTDRVRPVLAVSGMEFVHIPLNEYFRKAAERLPGIYDTKRWQVSDDWASADFRLSELGDDAYIRIEGGDLPGKTLRVSAIAYISGCDIPLKENRVSHTGTYDDSMYDALFEGIIDAAREYALMRKEHISFRCPELTAIKEVLGKKRSKKIDFYTLENLKGDKWEVIEKVVKETYTVLGEDQNGRLRNAYAALIKGA